MENTENYMDNLIARYLAGEELTAEESGLIEKWKKDDASGYQELERLFNTAGSKREIPVFDAEKAWKKVSPRLGKKGRSVQTIFLISSAACLLLVFAASLFLRKEKEDFTYVAEAVSEEKSCILPDGTEVTLHPGARIYYTDKEMQRNTRLEGDAFFEVAKDSSRPFTVDTENFRITVTGTSFLVKTDITGKESVYVRSGSVKVNNGKDSVDLKRMEKATSIGKRLIKSAIRTGEEIFPAEEQAILVFDNTPVAEAAREIQGHAGIFIEIDDEVKENTVTTTLDISVPENAVKELAHICGCKYEAISKRHYRLYY